MTSEPLDPFEAATELPPDEEELRRAPRRFRFLADVPAVMPRAVLSPAGRSGAVLSAGTVCILAGEGGVAKSALALSIAVGMASAPDEEPRPSAGASSTAAAGGCSWSPSRTRPASPPGGGSCWPAPSTRNQADGPAHAALRSGVGLLDLQGRALYGPAPDAPTTPGRGRSRAGETWRTPSLRSGPA